MKYDPFSLMTQCVSSLSAHFPAWSFIYPPFLYALLIFSAKMMSTKFLLMCHLSCFENVLSLYPYGNAIFFVWSSLSLTVTNGTTVLNYVSIVSEQWAQHAILVSNCFLCKKCFFVHKRMFFLIRSYLAAVHIFQISSSSQFDWIIEPIIRHSSFFLSIHTCFLETLP